MPSLADEILLLTLDDESGSFLPVKEYSLELALAGAVLMDLALRDRVDADLEHLMVVDQTPTGDPVLDPVLVELVRSEERSLKKWLLELARVRFLRQRTLERLVEAGILRCEDKKILWVFGSRRYPAVGGKEQREVKQRVLDIILRDEIPDPRDVVLICLARACSLLPSILGQGRSSNSTARIEAITRMDLIGKQMLDELVSLHASVETLGFWGVGEVPELERRIREAAS